MILDEYKALQTRVRQINEQIKNRKEEDPSAVENALKAVGGSNINEALTLQYYVEKDIEEKTLPFIAFIKQLLIAKCPFLANVLIDINEKIDFLQRGSLGVSVENMQICFKYNPLYIFQYYSLTEFIGVVLKELNKVIYFSYEFIHKHSDSDNSKNIAEIATEIMSYEILKNDVINNMNDRENGLRNKVRISSKAWTRESAEKKLSTKFQEDKEQDYYYNVINSWANKNKDKVQLLSNPELSGEDADNDCEGTEDGVASPFNNSGHGRYDDLQGENTQEDLRNASKELINRSYNNLSTEDRGKTPACYQQQIEKINMPPEISWQQELRSMIGTVPVPYRATKTRLNRRLPFRTDLSGRVPKKLVRIVLAIDTSGSVSDMAISKFLNELENILRVYKTEITVIECDAAIQRVYEVRKPTDIKYDAQGRGGTCFTPAINFINDDPKFRSALMIYCTDGYGESEIPKPLTYKNMWLVIGSQYLSVKKPYGKVKFLSETYGLEEE